jgi:hypothetical protein
MVISGYSQLKYKLIINYIIKVFGEEVIKYVEWRVWKGGGNEE